MLVWLTMAWAQTPPALTCGTDRARVQCVTEKGAHLALCETPKGWAYRYGTKEVELAWDGPFWTTHLTLGPDEELSTVGFEREGYSYAVAALQAGAKRNVRIDVAKAGKRLASLPCATVDKADLQGIALPAPPTSSWVGTWDGPTGSLTITEQGGTLHVTGDALWHGGGQRIHTGEVDGSLTTKDGALVYEQDGCELRIGRDGSQLWVEDNLQCGGLNVTFAGEYTRT